MLVYEYISGRSLKDHLHGSLANQCILDWKARFRVALDAAEDQASSHHLTDIIDKRFSLSENEMECFKYVVDLAIQCVDREGSRRPNMSEVVEGLKAAKHYIEPKVNTNAGNTMHALSPEEYSGVGYSSSLLHVGK
ncbi:hypothetical protein SUGI_0728060 [Cryptomeria japonica]|nr:hypothetical protein SUGI_0728060 [Cryptomeria japonica]